MRAKIFDLMMSVAVVIFFIYSVASYGALVAFGFFLLVGAAALTLYSYARGFFGGTPHASDTDARE